MLSIRNVLNATPCIKVEFMRALVLRRQYVAEAGRLARCIGRPTPNYREPASSRFVTASPTAPPTRTAGVGALSSDSNVVLGGSSCLL